MSILVTAATAMEIQPFFEYYAHAHPAKDIDVLISGIGLTVATYHLSKQMNLKRPDLVIQAGIAGCFNKKLPLGSVVAVKKETIADQGVIEMKQLKTLFDLGLIPQDQYPFKKGWLVNPRPLPGGLRLKKVTAISVNEITTSKEKMKFYDRSFKPVIESLEGAALHYACLMERVPFIQLRSISNYVGERDKRKWDIKTSIANLNRTLIKLIESL